MLKLWKEQRRLPDLTLLTIVFLLLFTGLIMVYSSSHVWAEYKYNDSFFFVKRQLLFAGVGVIGMLIIRSEEHTSELQSRGHLVCRLLLEKKRPTTNSSQAR